MVNTEIRLIIFFAAKDGEAYKVNKIVWNMVFGFNLKNDRMISIDFHSKQFNITVIQVYAPTTDTEEAEVDLFY